MHSRINVTDFNLAATLECGQAFRWSRHGENGWFEGVVGREVWRLRQSGDTLEWETGSKPTPSPSKEGNSKLRSQHPNAELPSNGGAGGGSHSVPSPVSCTGSRLRETPLSFAAKGQGEGSSILHYLALDASLSDIVTTFPANDKHLHGAVHKHWGLRVLRQEPWECLASFMASSTKQIVQIRQIVAELSRRFGEPLVGGRDALRRVHLAVGRDAFHRVQDYSRDAVPRVHGRAAAQPYLAAQPFHSFPSVGAIARASHKDLWDCKLGFRAKNLLAAARMIEDGKVNLDRLPAMEYDRALEELLKLPGVGEKIANCVLLFSCGFEQAFPVDVWIERALRRLYFPRRKATARQLRDFARSHFGLYAGWAQQYLFFNERTQRRNRE